MQYASRSNRIVGQLLDGLIAFAPVIGLAIVPIFGELVTGFYAIVWLGWMFFHVLLADGLEGGQSWGKRAAKTRVVDAESGNPCTFGQAFIRNFLLAILGPIDWVFIFGERHQRLGDKAAGTIVIPAG